MARAGKTTRWRIAIQTMPEALSYSSSAPKKPRPTSVNMPLMEDSASQ